MWGSLLCSCVGLVGVWGVVCRCRVGRMGMCCCLLRRPGCGVC